MRTKPRIKRSPFVVLPHPLSQVIFFGNYWECEGHTGMTPKLAYECWDLAQQRDRRLAAERDAAPQSRVFWRLRP